ncbi:MAG TPA: fluoride efflux transporter CrcB [Pyrinomonadaceae bacterium]|nr:fluoride efflux transporter CrcB [Chloracidobacterium sp.]HBE82039.1 fluoride efflux transporter CrcB [Blastocatellia bacterium]HRJ87985.1 fluoride efflux transporter CrcB [Pyrinomonadaceae bacterium]HRK49730.1 fluoride efflux transporter CrcB [Pyrinomonadaceae bacterium]
MEFTSKIVFIAFGGAFGAVSRYLLNISPLANIFDKFPFPTFFINVSGSFLIGFLLIVLTDKVEISDNLRMGVIVGFLGAFTTFSTFEMEIYGLIKDRFFTTAFLYLVLSVVVGFAGLLAGVWLARKF